MHMIKSSNYGTPTVLPTKALALVSTTAFCFHRVLALPSSLPLNGLCHSSAQCSWRMLGKSVSEEWWMKA